MNKQTRHKPTASKFSLLRQLCNLIPNHLVPRLARATGSQAQPVAAASSARHNRLICRITDNPMGHPQFIESKKHKILKPIFRHLRSFTRKTEEKRRSLRLKYPNQS